MLLHKRRVNAEGLKDRYQEAEQACSVWAVVVHELHAGHLHAIYRSSWIAYDHTTSYKCQLLHRGCLNAAQGLKKGTRKHSRPAANGLYLFYGLHAGHLHAMKSLFRCSHMQLQQ